MKGGVELIGWGATCNCHRDSPGGGVACKKQLLLQGMSSDVCRRYILGWLLAGLGIPGDGIPGEAPADARFQHVRETKPLAFPLRSEAELTADALAAWP